MEFFSNRIKITSKWTASYGSGATAVANASKKQRTLVIEDKASFDGKM
jgi:hypothetical protein